MKIHCSCCHDTNLIIVGRDRKNEKVLVTECPVCHGNTILRKYPYVIALVAMPIGALISQIVMWFILKGAK